MGKQGHADMVNQSERERWAGAVLRLWEKRQGGCETWTMSYRRARLTVHVYDQLLGRDEMGPARMAMARVDASIGLVTVCAKTGHTTWSK